MDYAKFPEMNSALNDYHTAIVQKGYIRKTVDSNNDNIFEIEQRFNKDSKKLMNETFDFDSNGATDYERSYHNGKLVSEWYYNNNPKNNEIVNPKLFQKLTTKAAAKLLELEAKKSPETEGLSLVQILKKQEKLLEAIKTKEKEGQPYSEPKFE